VTGYSGFKLEILIINDVVSVSFTQENCLHRLHLREEVSDMKVYSPINTLMKFLQISRIISNLINTRAHADASDIFAPHD
jgi:alpha-D-ribose 1-methylphosphonate 5-triphosphate diphosphatase PhnM